MDLDALKDHFLVVLLRLRLVMPYVLVLVRAYGESRRLRRDVGGKLK